MTREFLRAIFLKNFYFINAIISTLHTISVVLLLFTLIFKTWSGLEKVLRSPWLLISNSVTHLWSYTNSEIADIAGNSAPISPVTPRDRRRHRAECRYRRIEWPPRNRRRRYPKRRRLCIERDVSASSADIVASNDVFHDVSQCFKSVSWCLTSGSWCITMFYTCFMMFYYV